MVPSITAHFCPCAVTLPLVVVTETTTYMFLTAEAGNTIPDSILFYSASGGVLTLYVWMYW